MIRELLGYSFDWWRSEPALQINDAYKWLYQATLGFEQSPPHAAICEEWLANELARLGPPHVGEPLVVPLRPDARLVRLNLRPYQAHGGTARPLATAFLRSIDRFRVERSTFVAAWHLLRVALETITVGNLTATAWDQFDRITAPRTYPVMQHSDAYRQALQPAYRVLLGSEAWSLLQRIDALPERSERVLERG